MDIFHEYLIDWWQMGLMKIALIAIGIIIGAKWPKLFSRPIVCWTLFILFLVIAIYTIISIWPQI